MGYLEILKNNMEYTAMAVLVFFITIRVFSKKNTKELQKYTLKELNEDISKGLKQEIIGIKRDINRNINKEVREIKKELKEVKLEINKKINKETKKDDSLEDKDKRQEIGQEYEKSVGYYYETEGYEVEYRGLELGEKDGGIDLIATKKNDNKKDEMLLIQCKKWGKPESIGHEMIKQFYGDCHFYLDNNFKLFTDYTIHCIYAVHKDTVFKPSARMTFNKNKKKCRYRVIEG